MIALATLSSVACQSPASMPEDLGTIGDAGVGTDGAPPSGDGSVVGSTPYPWPVWTPTIPAVPPSATGATYYVDAKNGDDAQDGKSLANALRTLAKAVSLVAAGDTVLIRAGLYREGIRLEGSVSGTSTKPITFGSYGDGEVILDGSTAVTGWTKVTGSTWKATIAFTPIAVVVNDVPLKQVRQGQGGSTAPAEGLAGVTTGSGKWYWDAGAKQIYADMQTTLAAGDPNTADIVVPSDDGAQYHVYFYRADYVTFKGLTIRGSGSNGVWGYGSHVTVESCNIKFNGKSAVSYQVDSDGTGNSDDAVLTSHIYHNVLLNWPRGNNGFAESGGGWAGGVAWSTILRPLARGNIVHKNGGEGVISYGTQAGKPSGSALFEQNVVYDNWSVDMYFDNQPNDVARNNFIFNHPPDASDFLYVGSTDPYNALQKFNVCLMLADEENSSDATNDYANLDHVQIYDNIIAGCRVAIRDYSEGNAHAVLYHGLKNALIANNTILMPAMSFTNTNVIGIFLQDNKTPSGVQRNTNSYIQNNIVYGFTSDPLIWTEATGTISGITVDYNAYFAPGASVFSLGSGTVQNVAMTAWQSQTGADAHSQFVDPQLVAANQFQTAGVTPYDPSKAAPMASSPVRGAGTMQTAFADDFSGAPRSGWNIGAY